MLPLQIATRLSMLKSENIYYEHYKTEEKKNFHLPISELLAKRYCQFGPLTLFQLSSGMTLPTKGGHYGPEQNQGS